MENIGDNIISKNFLRKYHHDMREPLRNVSSFLQIIKMDLTNNTTNINDLLYYINNAINCLSILDDFNNSILNYTENNSINNIKPHNLNLIINKIACLLSSQMTKRKCNVEVQDNLPLIKCSSIDLCRIFKNLIENSIKYAVCEELVIKISCCGKENDTVMLLFEDNGIVLNNETIIEIKRTLNEQMIGNNKLASFGLSIVRELIHKNNGNITLLENHSGCSYKISLMAL